MKYDAEISSGSMIYISSFIKIGSAIQKLTWGYKDSISLLSLAKNKRQYTSLLRK
jgi:hypothetical protein